MGIWPTNMPKHKTVKVSWHKGCKQFSLNRSQILHVSISWVFRVVGFDELLVKCIWVHLGAPRVIRGFAERCSPKFTGWSWIHQKISKAQKRSNNLTPHCKKSVDLPFVVFSYCYNSIPCWYWHPILWSQTSDESSHTTAVTPGISLFLNGRRDDFPIRC